MGVTEEELVKALSTYVPRDEAARVALGTAHRFWQRAGALEASADQLAARMRPRGDRQLREEADRLHGEARALQQQTHAWLLIAERFGSTAVVWEEYATDFEPNPGFWSPFHDGDPAIPLPYLPSPGYTPPELPLVPPVRRGPLYGLVGQPYPHLVLHDSDPEAPWSWIGYATDTFTAQLGTCPKPAPGVDRFWRARTLDRNPIKAQAFKHAIELILDADPNGRAALEDMYPDLVLAAGRTANWRRRSVPVDGNPEDARVFGLPADTLICLLDLPDAYVVLCGRPLDVADIAMETLRGPE